MANEKVTVFVTKFALTKGVMEMELEKTRTAGMLKHYDGTSITKYFHEREYCLFHGDARLKAESMRAAKIASLQRQLAILQALTFD